MPGRMFRIEIEQVECCAFRVRPDRPPVVELVVGAPAPFERGLAPNPRRLPASAVARCVAGAAWDGEGQPPIGGVDVAVGVAA